jgi:hypothetical protein
MKNIPFTRIIFNLHNIYIYIHGILQEKEKLQQIKYGKLLNFKLIQDLEDDHPPLQNISDEKGLTLAYEAKNGLYQHHNKLFIAGTRDLQDAWDDLKIPFGKTMDGVRADNANAYYLANQSSIDTVIGHSLGGAIALNLKQKYGKKGDLAGAPYGIIQSKTFGSPTIGSIFEGTNDRIRYLGDPISMLDFGATTKIPSLSQRWNNSAHSFSGLEIEDRVLLHDVPKNPLTPSPPDTEAEIITE